jgi:hypothetical protein
MGLVCANWLPSYSQIRAHLLFLFLKLVFNPLAIGTCILKSALLAHESLGAHVHNSSHSSGLGNCGWMWLVLNYMRTPLKHFNLKFSGQVAYMKTRPNSTQIAMWQPKYMNSIQLLLLCLGDPSNITDLFQGYCDMDESFYVVDYPNF